MKMAIITMYYQSRNAGGLLQSYAMQKILTKMGYEAEQISYIMNSQNMTTEDKVSNTIQNEGSWYILYKVVRKIYRVIKKKVVYYFLMPKFEKKVNSLSSYMKHYQEWIPHTDKSYTYDNIKQIGDVYDVYVTGSDQVWGTGYKDREVYTLGFVQMKRKVAYAPSIARDNMTEGEIKELCKNLHSFDAVSLREDKYQKMMEKELNREVPVVLDPTMLLSRADWDEMLSSYPLTEEEYKDSHFDEPYIFVYLLGGDINNQKRIEKFVQKQRIIDKKDLKTVYCPYVVAGENREFLHWKGRNFGDYRIEHLSPAVFVKLIKNAAYVVTDSFHACVFSILYHTQFVVLDRFVTIKGVSMNSRLDTLLRELGLEENYCRMREEIGVRTTDWEKVDEDLEDQRDYSVEYLRKALEG